MGDISEAVRVYNEMKRLLEAEVPDIDEETLLDTLEGETDLHERIASLCRAALNAESSAAACTQRADETYARASRHVERAKRLRDIALWAMSEAGLQKVKAPDITVSVSPGKAATFISDETQIPDRFFEMKPKLLTKELRAALDAGEDIPGATLTNPKPYITVRK